METGNPRWEPTTPSQAPALGPGSFCGGELCCVPLDVEPQQWPPLDRCLVYALVIMTTKNVYLEVMRKQLHLP